MKNIKKFFSVIVACLLVLSAHAQNDVQMADTMRSEGKIYVVVGIILIILVGLITYLFLLDRKVKKLEDRLSGKP